MLKQYLIFKVTRMSSVIQKEIKYKFCIMMKYGETFATATRYLTPTAVIKIKI